jgi:hypothetical protein
MTPEMLPSGQRFARLSAYQALQIQMVKIPAHADVEPAATKVQRGGMSSTKYVRRTMEPNSTTAMIFTKFALSAIDRRA